MRFRGLSRVKAADSRPLAHVGVGVQIEPGAAAVMVQVHRRTAPIRDHIVFGNVVVVQLVEVVPGNVDIVVQVVARIV